MKILSINLGYEKDEPFFSREYSRELLEIVKSYCSFKYEIYRLFI